MISANATLGKAQLLLKTVSDYAKSTARLKPLSEWLSSFSGQELWTKFAATDKVAGVHVDSSVILEHQSQFCDARDYVYARRSRRFLLTQGVQNKLRCGYELGMAYMRENSQTDLEAYLALDPAVLAQKTYNQLRDPVKS